MKRWTIILVALFCFLPSELRAQVSGILKPLAYVDGLMSRGRIAAAGRIPDIASPFMADSKPIDRTLGFGEKNISEDYRFISYLDENSLNDDALTLMCSSLYRKSDTLSFLRGWTFYKTKHLEDAVRCFSEVPGSSAFYDQAVFFSVASSAHLADFGKAMETLDSYNGPLSDLKNLQAAGISLLQGDYKGYDSYAPKIGGSHYAIEEAARDLSVQAALMRSCRMKSPVMAGIESAIIPGLGKICAGRVGEGVMSFLTVGAFGAMTAENWIRCGANDWKTILFGTLGTICYISNIYGSCMAVKVMNQNTIRGYETAVLVDIHIPLYSVLR